MKTPTINPQLLLAALGWLVSQAVAFGVLNTGDAQTVIAVGGIVIPAVLALAAALHLGRVHAAQIVAAPVVVPAVVAPAPVAAAPAAVAPLPDA